MLASLVRLALVVALALAGCSPWPDLPDGPGLPPPLPPHLTLRALAAPSPPGDAPHCGAALRLVAALPHPSTDPGEVEWVAVASAEPVPISLRDWHLRAGRRRVDLPPIALAPGEALVLGGRGGVASLGSLRLPNRAGALRLVDPCGLERDRTTWGDGGCPAAPGVPILGDVAPDLHGWAGAVLPWKHEGPTRARADGAMGGCGQT